MRKGGEGERWRGGKESRSEVDLPLMTGMIARC